MRVAKVALAIMYHGGHIYWEWPKGCSAWKAAAWHYFLRELKKVGVEIYYVEVHGCAFGLRDEDSGQDPAVR